MLFGEISLLSFSTYRRLDRCIIHLSFRSRDQKTGYRNPAFTLNLLQKKAFMIYVLVHEERGFSSIYPSIHLPAEVSCSNFKVRGMALGVLQHIIAFPSSISNRRKFN
ncbi:hypothetical protein ATANTOWER_026119 [Ataeniobius toweri]|uniref:Maturase K n=1 Tax=Ataeniobius toweri TaxID=208326 RepID=A0ABU7BNE7_9TELE|nr:hypothetical protein [Ataeniobius toweri]